MRCSDGPCKHASFALSILTLAFIDKRRPSSLLSQYSNRSKSEHGRLSYDISSTADLANFESPPRFGNTRQARLAGTRKEARHAPLPGQPGTGTAPRRSRGDTTSMYHQPFASGSGLSSFDSGGFASIGSMGSMGGGLPPLSLGNIGRSSSGNLPSLSSSGLGGLGYEPNSSSFRSSGGQGSLFPPLDPLPMSLGGTGGLLPGFGPNQSSGAGAQQSAANRSRRRSITS